MKKILTAAALAACTALAPTATSAGPVYTRYQFQLLTYGCSNGAPSCGGATGDIGSLYVGIEGNAGSIDVATTGSGHPMGSHYFNTNIVEAGFDGLRTPVDLQTGICDSRYFCHVSATFAFDAAIGMLKGWFRAVNDNDMHEMASDASGLWSGYFMSDDGMHTVDRRPVFTGTFSAQIVSMPVPEPASIMLVGVGLAGLLFARRRSRN